MNENFFDLAAKRQSCRNFDPSRPVENTLLRKIIETARLAPSACNSQPWHFTVVNSPDRSPAVAKSLQSMNMNRFTSQCPAFIIINEERAKLAAIVGGRFKNQHYAGFDIGLAAAHICLSASELGLSTCILGWFEADELKKAAEIKPDRTISLVIAIGYSADDTIRLKVRKPLDEIATFL